MKTTRQAKILELIQKKDVETQEELSAYLEKEGFQVTQATVSRDIRELKLTKISTDNGRQKYAVITDADSNMMEKYARVLREGFLSVDAAENIVVIKTVSGMASIAKQLEEAKANPDIPEVEVMIRTGRIRETLKHEMLDVVKPDLVLCGARGLSSIKYALLGSISTFLLRNTDCDILVVK